MTDTPAGAAPLAEPAPPDLSGLLAKSASADLTSLLSAKENARRAMQEDPTKANIDAFEKARRAVALAEAEKANLKDVGAVLRYLQEAGRKVQKTKLYDDVASGLVRRQPDGTFRLRDVDRYAASLPALGTSDKKANEAEKRQKRKEEAEIRRIEAAAKRDELRLAKESGALISREQVYTELAARAVTLAAGIRTAFETRMLDLIHSVSGNPKKAQNMIQEFETILDAAMNEYADTEDFDVLFVASGGELQDSEEDQEDI